MTKIMNENVWNKVELLTGVARPDAVEVSVSVSYERGFNFYELFMFNEGIQTSLLSPRLKLRYLQLGALMHYTKSSISSVLTMRQADLDRLLTKLKKQRSKIASVNAVGELEKLFKGGNEEDGFHLLFHAPNKPHAPLSKAKVMKLFLDLTEKIEEPEDMSYDVS